MHDFSSAESLLIISRLFVYCILLDAPKANYILLRCKNFMMCLLIVYPSVIGGISQDRSLVVGASKFPHKNPQFFPFDFYKCYTRPKSVQYPSFLTQKRRACVPIILRVITPGVVGCQKWYANLQLSGFSY